VMSFASSFDADQWRLQPAVGLLSRHFWAANMIHDLMLPVTDTAGDGTRSRPQWPWPPRLGAPLVSRSTSPCRCRAPLASHRTSCWTRCRFNSVPMRSGRQRSFAPVLKEAVSWEVRVDGNRSLDPQSMAFQARYADLSVIAAPTGADDGAVARRSSAPCCSNRAAGACRPAHHPAEFPLRHVVVAWNPRADGCALR
jgi:hypothetical protein